MVVKDKVCAMIAGFTCAAGPEPLGRSHNTLAIEHDRTQAPPDDVGAIRHESRVHFANFSFSSRQSGNFRKMAILRTDHDATSSERMPLLYDAGSHEDEPSSPTKAVGALPVPPVDRKDKLHRGLSARQVQMIAIAGTIGTGLFLGTGRSLAQGGPASMLICYCIVGFIVYVTLLLLGEMATQYPVAGEFHLHFIDLSGRSRAPWPHVGF